MPQRVYSCLHADGPRACVYTSRPERIPSLDQEQTAQTSPQSDPRHRRDDLADHRRRWSHIVRPHPRHSCGTLRYLDHEPPVGQTERDSRNARLELRDFRSPRIHASRPGQGARDHAKYDPRGGLDLARPAIPSLGAEMACSSSGLPNNHDSCGRHHSRLGSHDRRGLRPPAYAAFGEAARRQIRTVRSIGRGRARRRGRFTHRGSRRQGVATHSPMWGGVNVFDLLSMNVTIALAQSSPLLVTSTSVTASRFPRWTTVAVAVMSPS